VKHQPVVKDERTVVVENASFRWGFFVLFFGLMLDGTYRGLLNVGVIAQTPFLIASNWDLLGLVMLGSVVTMGYQLAQGTLWPLLKETRWLWVIVIVAQAAVAWAIVWAMNHWGHP
jgi:hypothetical protein